MSEQAVPPQIAENSSKQSVTGLVTHIKVGSDERTKTLTDWLLNLMMQGAQAPGFWSGEILPPGPTRQLEWKLIQRFNRPEEAMAWRASEDRGALLKQAEHLLNNNSIVITDEISDHGLSGSVATAFISTLAPDHKEQYWKWVVQMQSTQARFPGYAGVYFEPPTPQREHHWTTVLRFDSPANLETWFASPERKQLLDDSKELVRETKVQHLSSPYPGWFPSADKSDTPKWKGAVMVIVALYPIIGVMRHTLTPILEQIHSEIGKAVGCLISVGLVSWVAMPFLIQHFGWWLSPTNPRDKYVDLKGFLLAAFLFLIEIVAIGIFLPH